MSKSEELAKLAGKLLSGAVGQVLKRTATGYEFQEADVTGTWTPTLTFATPGNLSVAYSTQTGSYERIGRLVTVRFHIVTSTFTHTTASGLCQVTGLPFTAGEQCNGGTSFVENVTKAGFDYVSWYIPNASTRLELQATRLTGGTSSGISAADMASGVTTILSGTVTYRV